MEPAKTMITATNIERYEKPIEEALAALSRQRIISRIWKKDWTVWRDAPQEIASRLGWLTSPREMEDSLEGIARFAQVCRSKGFTHALLLGMGGSSLAPLVLGDIFKAAPGNLELDILDSTDPAAVLDVQKKLNIGKTLFIVSSKSGTTTETDSFFKFFWNRASASQGEANAGTHFAAITDRGTPLEDAAKRLRFAFTFHGNPEIGGRFSALSPFGLVPASLKGIPIHEILRTANDMAALCREETDLRHNPGAYLGTILGVLNHHGLDKATFLLSRRLESLGLWLEQLLAESTGKQGRGILPVAGEPIGPAKVYGRDRLFVYFKEENGQAKATAVARLERAGFPVLFLTFPGLHHIGSQFFLWEFATAVAGFFLGINPFDQPNVESAKKKTRKILDIYCRQGIFPGENPAFETAEVSLLSDMQAPSLESCLSIFLEQARTGDYVAIQAFLAPKKRTTSLLQNLRGILRQRTGLATTMGYGPRFLHSTGQLHKGDRGNGMFLQITSEDEKDAAIPDEPGSPRSTLSFGVLKAAQALGDYETLKSSGRRIIRLHLRKDVGAGLEKAIQLFRST